MKTSKKIWVLSLTAMFVMFASSQASAASLKGKVAFEGQAPAAEAIKADADPKCKAMHADGLSSDSVIVNENGTLKNVFVYVKSGLEGKKFDAPKDSVKLDQHGCMYSPKVFGIMAGQELEIINSDDTLHNVHSLATKSKQFNLGMPLKGMKLKKKFEAPEVMVKIKCEVHPWMATYAGVTDNPFYSVTNEQGEFEIKDLPAGEYEVEIWHEKYGVQSSKVTVSAEDQELNFSVKG